MCFYTLILNIGPNCSRVICPTDWSKRTTLVNMHFHGESNLQRCQADYKCMQYSFCVLIGQKRRWIEAGLDVENV